MKRALVIVFVCLVAFWGRSDAKPSGDDALSAIERLVGQVQNKCGLDTPGKVKPTHTACLGPAQNMVESRPVTEEQKRQIIHLHNEARRTVDPPAANMGKMMWDDELAMIAQKWAERCVYKHDGHMSIPGKYGVGQNIGRYKFGLVGSWKEVIDAFNEEKNRWHYTGYSSKMHTGHYTQIIWATTTKVGCGAAVCEFDYAYYGYKKWYYYVCDYANGGNMPGMPPYKKSSESCSGCANNCENKLCVCNDDPSNKKTSICHNGGKLKVDTCSCDCTGRMQTGYKCTECEDNPDGKYGRKCTSDTIKNDFCRKYWDVRIACCKTCTQSDP